VATGRERHDLDGTIPLASVCRPYSDQPFGSPVGRWLHPRIQCRCSTQNRVLAFGCLEAVLLVSFSMELATISLILGSSSFFPPLTLGPGFLGSRSTAHPPHLPTLPTFSLQPALFPFYLHYLPTYLRCNRPDPPCSFQLFKADRARHVDLSTRVRSRQHQKAAW